MDLELTEEQELLRETTARFIESECPLTRVRELIDDPVGFDRDYLRKSAELGWFGALVPEEFGGGSVSGSGLLDAAVIAEERGGMVQPGPFLPMNVVGFALANAGTADQQRQVLPDLAAGESVATWALAGANGDWSPGAGISAVLTNGSFVLSGTKGFVQDASAADWLLVAASTERGLTQFLVPAGTDGVRIERLDGLDLARRFGEVSFENVMLPESSIVGTVGEADHDVECQLQVALVLSIAESVGAMNRLFDITLQYAKDRTAFGRPIGSFQAIKHLLADLSMHLEACNAGAVAAGRAAQDRSEDAAEVVSIAKSYVGDRSIELAQGCLQAHGGIGYTWDHDLHLYLRRLTVNNALYGEPSWHRERVCTLNGI
jgi:alkylation response protein AidB-like acyl-CoA dehydrogenase